MKTFDEISDYFNEHGYTVMHRNPEKTWANFASIKGETSIELIFTGNEFRAYGCGFIPKSMIQIKTGGFSLPNKNLFFNLSRIEKSIEILKGYEV